MAGVLPTFFCFLFMLLLLLVTISWLLRRWTKLRTIRIVLRRASIRSASTLNFTALATPRSWKILLWSLARIWILTDRLFRPPLTPSPSEEFDPPLDPPWKTLLVVEALSGTETMYWATQPLPIHDLWQPSLFYYFGHVAMNPTFRPEYLKHTLIWTFPMCNISCGVLSHWSTLFLPTLC